MKFLLTAVNAKYIHSNLAVYNLEAYAIKYKDQIEVAEYTINHSASEILKGIYQRKPDAVGFSCYIWNISMIEDVMRELHKLLPGLDIWLGGPEATVRAGELLAEFPFLTGIMTGEGEETFRQLMEYYVEESRPLSQVQNLVFWEKGGIRRNPVGPLLDLSSVPFPYKNLENLKNRIIYYETSRGCPFSCSYCLSSVDKKLRFRNMSMVKKELDFFLKEQVPQVKFVDRTFNCNQERALEIWTYLKEHDNGVTNFHFEAAADLMTEEELKLIRSMRPGLIQLEIGIQSANQDTIKAIDRVMDLEKVKKVTKAIHESKNIHQHLDLIAGLPYEDFASFADSFNQVYRLKPDQLQLGFLKVLAGTRMGERAEEYGICCQSRPPYEVLFTKWISYEEMLQLKSVEEMVEVYYNSFQFTHSMAFLEPYFQTPFSLYLTLGEFYEKQGLFGRMPNRMERYETLIRFAAGFLSRKELEVFQEYVTYDLYLRENMKKRPDFAGSMEQDKEWVRQFYKEEARERNYLAEYEGYDGRKLAKMTHIQRFTRNPVTGEEGEVYILFDYQKRNPLTYEAAVHVLKRQQHL